MIENGWDLVSCVVDGVCEIVEDADGEVDDAESDERGYTLLIMASPRLDSRQLSSTNL